MFVSQRIEQFDLVSYGSFHYFLSWTLLILIEFEEMLSSDSCGTTGAQKVPQIASFIFP